MAYTLKAAKAWFQAHPTCRVIYHRRMKELSQASRERLELPRTVTIRGTRAVFSDGSEVSLRTETDTSSSSNPNLLDIFDADGSIIVTYAGVTA